MSAPFSQETDLGRLTERLGSTLLTLVAGEAQSTRTISTVVLLDPLDPPDVVPGALVLGVGVGADGDLESLVEELGESRAAALIVREPVTIDPGVAESARRHQVSVFGLVRGASWVQVATLLAGALNIGTDEHGSADVDSGRDLFTLANALSALLGAPVTIEDRSSRVVAFSADQAGTDEPRRLTILGLQVPELYSSIQRERGVFRRIYQSDRPIYLEKPAPDTLPRVVMRVQAGGEVMGSIWAVVSEPLTPEREQGMIEGAQVVALAMLRARVSADASQRLSESIASRLLEGGTSAREAAQQLGIESSPACVIAIGPSSGPDEVRIAADTQRAASALRMNLQPVFPRAIAAQLGGVVYAVVPFRTNDDRTMAAVENLASEFIARLDTTSEFCAGLGDVVPDIGDLHLSRRDADAALRVVRSRSRSRERVARFADVQLDAVMHRISDSIKADRIQFHGPLETLREYDHTHGAELISTLQSWLEHFGDVTAAAQAMHVHKNTLRYRLDRVAAIAGADLSDPDVRFSLLLQLRLATGPTEAHRRP
ncbi:helix-turn-helix domain-containing protein [Aeromicrobium endophyticum]|uniref:PucR family transcriptional regulator n=1 Tax=Aeromicrobium endophyticum TaxID=2292704 RepID=A0A371PDX5_9ACTN|nr:PucR family transcriptional regulator [Aeromicrobium endophyticum]REK73620.1 PucR family transcriptional regulator [Aeromicrobium endophyticum]